MATREPESYLRVMNIVCTDNGGMTELTSVVGRKDSSASPIEPITDVISIVAEAATPIMLDTISAISSDEEYQRIERQLTILSKYKTTKRARLLRRQAAIRNNVAKTLFNDFEIVSIDTEPLIAI